MCGEVCATEGYEDSVAHLAGVSLDRDTLFSDGYSLQLATAPARSRRGTSRR